MANLDQTRTDPTRQLWDELDDIHAVMLGVHGSDDHMQPMAPQGDPAQNVIWFYSAVDHDLVNAIGSSSPGRACLIGKDHDYHACIAGQLSTSHDKEIIDRFWSPITAAWYEHGKDDPRLILVKFTLETATVWASTSSSLTFGWEIAKANIVGGSPDVGAQTTITFVQS